MLSTFHLRKFLGIQYIISEVQGYNVHHSMGNVSHQFREGGHHSQFNKTLSSQSMLCGIRYYVCE